MLMLMLAFIGHIKFLILLIDLFNGWGLGSMKSGGFVLTVWTIDVSCSYS